MIFSKLKKIFLQDKYFIKKLFSTSINRGLAAFGTFFFNFSLAKFLGINEFGNFMIAYSLSIGLGFIARFGMASAILRFGSIMVSKNQFGKIKKLRKDVFKISMLTSIGLALIVIIFRKFIISWFSDNSNLELLLISFAISLPFNSYLTIQSSFLKAYKKPEIAPLFEIGLTVFITGLIVAIFALLGTKINGIIASVIFGISCLIILLIGNFILNKIVKKTENGFFYKEENFEGFYKSLPDYSISAITVYILKFSPTIVLGMFYSGKDVGLFSVANSTAFFITFIEWIVNSVYAPHFASYYHLGKINELKKLVINSTIYMLAIAFPIFLILISFPNLILSYFGNEFLEAKLGLIILASAQLFNVATGPVYFLLNMTGHEKSLRNIVIFTAIISISASFILIPKFGFLGAVYATALGLVIQNIISVHNSSKILGFSFFTKFNKN